MKTIEEKDVKVEIFLGNVLLYGVIASAVFMLLGGILYLFQHGGTIPDYSVFSDKEKSLWSVSEIINGLLELKSIPIMQLGVILLIATPVMRVAFSIVAFFYEKDFMYIIFTLIVLGILLFSLFR